ncbi:MAG: hypothetical protein IPH62_17140 [Ignavibacteriae bacterium]|nr:hypothetical protein [Ignavibacteriota bacterium]
MSNKIILLFLCVFSVNLFSQSEDSLNSFWLKQVEINAKKLSLGDATNQISKDNLENVLGKNGFSLIRKGVFFAQDIYADGLKKGDINVVIDGERYHSACPNRMDSPLTRINPLDLESVDLNKSSNNIQAGLGGVVQFNRSIPNDNLNVQLGLSTLTGAQNGIDFAGATDFQNQRINLRYANGSPFVDGDKRTFSDSYGFKENYNFTLAEGSLRGMINKLSYGFSFSYTDNVSFPYLLMDERLNRVYSSFIRYENHKLYFNFTDHVMDNDLRVNTMLMRTSAKNLTVGAIGDFYEIVYRNWDANNFFKSAMVNLENDLMPNVNSYLVNLFKTFEFSRIQLHSKIGLSYQKVGDESREEFYNVYFNNVKLERYFPVFSFGISHTNIIFNNVGLGGMIEVNSESPETESLFIAVKKPGTKPAWSGNPNLDQPIKATLRSSITYNNFSLELFGSKVWNYNNLSKQFIDQTAFLTYSNIDATILGANFYTKYDFLEFDLSYLWAKNNSNNLPLSEIPPLKIGTKIISPEYLNFTFFLKHTYNDAQLRIDDLLDETTSGAWNKIDLGINYNFNQYSVSVEIENILNANYYQHLSYLRDPFASGLKVFEPGRVFRISFKTNQLF